MSAKSNRKTQQESKHQAVSNKHKHKQKMNIMWLSREQVLKLRKEIMDDDSLTSFPSWDEPKQSIPYIEVEIVVTKSKEVENRIVVTNAIVETDDAQVNRLKTKNRRNRQRRRRRPAC